MQLALKKHTVQKRRLEQHVDYEGIEGSSFTSVTEEGDISSGLGIWHSFRSTEDIEREQQQQCQEQEAEGAVERADQPEGSSKESVFLNNAGRIIVKKWK